MSPATFAVIVGLLLLACQLASSRQHATIVRVLNASISSQKIPHIMEELVHRLKGLTPAINDICRISGCPGVSIGVLHHKQVIFQQGYGYRDLERKLPPDEHTIYYLASMSKSFTASLVGMLVEKGKMNWSTPISKILPKYHQLNAEIRDEATIVDWMSHRTGAAPKNAIWSASYGALTMRRRDALPTISYLEKVADFRSRWIYSNWGYALADEVITHLDGRSWGTMLKDEIFDPLGMSRTITEHDSDLDNIAESYMAKSDGTPYHLPRPGPEDGKVMEGAVAVQSNVHDLLMYYNTLMAAADDQMKSGKPCTSGNPLKHVEMLLKGHIDLEPEFTENERSYGLGWIRTELPGTLGVIGLNPRYTSRMPVVGKGLGEKCLCIYHQGSTNTFLSSVHLLPRSNTAIVVLTNALGRNDTADWLGELLVQTVLDVPKEAQNDYVKIAQSSAEWSMSLWPAMRRELEDKRVKDTPVRDLEQYVGRYSNVVETFYLDIVHKDGRLWLSFADQNHDLYELDHYHFDVFSWLVTRDEDVRHGRFPVTRADFYILSFKADADQHTIDGLVWSHDPAIPEGELLRKRRKQDSETVIEGPV